MPDLITQEVKQAGDEIQEDDHYDPFSENRRDGHFHNFAISSAASAARINAVASTNVSFVIPSEVHTVVDASTIMQVEELILFEQISCPLDKPQRNQHRHDEQNDRDDLFEKLE